MFNNCRLCLNWLWLTWLNLRGLFQCPLVSTASLTMFLHTTRSWARCNRLEMEFLHQSLMLSIHLNLGLPLRLLPSMMPKVTCFISLSSFILQMCPKRPSFRRIIVWVMFSLMSRRSRIVMFRTLWNHRMFRILR